VAIGIIIGLFLGPKYTDFLTGIIIGPFLCAFLGIVLGAFATPVVKCLHSLFNYIIQ